MDITDVLIFRNSLIYKRSRYIHPCAGQEGVWMNGDIALVILKLGAKWRRMVTLMPPASFLGKAPLID